MPTITDLFNQNPSVNTGGTVVASRTLNPVIYTPFYTTDIVTSQQSIVEPVWNNESASIQTFYTSSTQYSATGQYYYDVYQTDPYTDPTVAPQFTIAYGHRLGSGSSNINANAGVEGMSPSKAIYSQYRTLLLSDASTAGTLQFELGNGKTTDSIITLSVYRQQLKDRIDPGNWEITMSGSNGSLYTFIDNSNSYITNTGLSSQRSFDIISGSLISGSYNSGSEVYYGKVYPGLGIYVFDADMLRDSASIYIQTSSSLDTSLTGSAYQNMNSVLSAISGAAAFGASQSPVIDYGFKARNEQFITSNYYFVRIVNQNYNYSSNPSFIYGTNGQLRWPDMVNDPKVYITTIGLYNDNAELLAVAKLSRPLLKTFDREALIRVKLDW